MRHSFPRDAKIWSRSGERSRIARSAPHNEQNEPGRHDRGRREAGPTKSLVQQQPSGPRAEHHRRLPQRGDVPHRCEAYGGEHHRIRKGEAGARDEIAAPVAAHGAQQCRAPSPCDPGGRQRERGTAHDGNAVAEPAASPGAFGVEGGVRANGGGGEPGPQQRRPRDTRAYERGQPPTTMAIASQASAGSTSPRKHTPPSAARSAPPPRASGYASEKSPWW